ncbi:MAG TPA: hypothetical protein VN634_16190 [Candidatus Limnocylindrales bacterium]|nr:hypothetical protein [Candidatus Limnocylindrales bacterium]
MAVALCVGIVAADVCIADAPPAWMRRGDEVEALSRQYDSRLQSFYDELSATVKTRAPDLYARLKEAPPAPSVYGYGLLPHVLPPAATAPATPVPARSLRYSWPWTQQKIADATKNLDALRTDLEHAGSLRGKEQREALARIADRYPDLTAAQRNIGEHIRYNREWQSEIALRRAAYDRATRFHDLVVERQQIADALATGDDAAFARATATLAGIDRSQPRSRIERVLRERASADTKEIQQELDRIAIPAYVHVSHQRHRSTVQVRMYTDIDDAGFLAEFRHAVEDIWHLRAGGEEFRVELVLVPVNVEHLYRAQAGCERSTEKRCTPPQRGDHIDLAAHAALFPTGGARLTTGAGTTHAEQGTIFLGPGDIDRHVLAHEFGHILGLRDEYFRGYRDLGADGFEVMEIVADPVHLMGNPGSGTVTRRYYERLLAARAN